MYLTRVDWSGRHLTPAGSRGKFETPQVRSAEEARIPPRGKQVPAAQRNGQYSMLKQHSFRKEPLLNTKS